MDNLTTQNKFVTAMDAAAAGTTTLNGSIVVDFYGADEVTFIASLGDVANGCSPTLSVDGNTSNSTTGMAAFTGASASFDATATNADLKKIAVTIVRPTKRYGRVNLARAGGNCVLNDITCVLSKNRITPVGSSTPWVAGDVVAATIA